MQCRRLYRDWLMSTVPMRGGLVLCFISLGVLTLSANGTRGQTCAEHMATQERPQGFDVVSIRPSKAINQESDITPSGDGYNLKNTSILELISIAYDVRKEQIEGLPPWAKSERFDVLARVTDPRSASSEDLSWSQRRSFLLAVLGERFRLQAHLTEASRPTYLLQAISNANKLQKSALVTSRPDGKPMDTSLLEGDIVVTDRFLKGNGVPVALLAKNLGLILEREVVDSTGYQGLYNISLQWVPYDAPAPEPGSFDVRSELLEALRAQLGLKLTGRRGAVKIIKVDKVERPSPN